MTFNYSDLQKMVSDWESPALEFKMSVQKDAGQTISAFANTYGGAIVFGAEPKKRELRGLTNPDEESRRLRELLDNCRPNPKHEQGFVRHEGKTFIVLKVEPFACSQNPCFYDKLCYIRQGTTNKYLIGEDLVDFLRRRTVLNFEELKCRATLDDLDSAKIEGYFKARGIEFDRRNTEALKTRLVGMKVAGFNGSFYLKNVAAMFFAAKPDFFQNSLEARLVVYSGREKTVEAIKTDERISGTIPWLVEEISRKIEKNIGRTFTIEGVHRKEVLDYPVKALREIVTNALGHRDYFDPMPCLIEIYPDRLTVTNPGGLLPGQSLSNFFKNPVHRNPITYRLLQDYHLGEGLGTGIEKIYSQCRKAGLADPLFNNFGNAFQVVLYNKSSERKRHLEDFENERQQQVIAYLEKNKTAKAKQFAKIAGVSEPTAIKDLNELMKQGKIKRVGKFRGAYYELAKH
ncbi:putative DNA binding domain-containing protein [Candidatus Micrarchaeota archaeon]|nr:putative DNA binding domain-containing protein [Candidatus Micrarchaeota archaeon]